MMIGATLSRWTMTYFAAALIGLLVGVALMTAGFGFPSAELASPDTLVLIHVICIGWLSLAMVGALIQFVPVLVAQPLISGRLALPVLILLVSGLGFLSAGFLSLGGHLPPALWQLPVGAVLLTAGFVLIIVDLGLTVWLRPTGAARFVLVGLASLLATALFGCIFAFALAGWTGSFGDLVLASGLPLHAIAGLGGWLTLTAMGVSYRLLTMFMLAPDTKDRQTAVTLAAGLLAVTVTVAGGGIAIAAGSGMTVVLASAAVLGMICIALYGRDVAEIFRSRRRRQLELNMRMAKTSFVSLMATAVLGVALIATGKFAVHVGAVAFLAIFGWLSGLVLATLYKIVAFLTWLETYGPIMGRALTPRVQDLVAERRAAKWFVVYDVAVWAGTFTLLLGLTSVFRVCAAMMMVAILGLMREIVRIRRLADVDSAVRLPVGAIVPPLLFAKS
jgi:hypothetical protein